MYYFYCFKSINILFSDIKKTRLPEKPKDFNLEIEGGNFPIVPQFKLQYPQKVAVGGISMVLFFIIILIYFVKKI